MESEISSITDGILYKIGLGNRTLKSKEQELSKAVKTFFEGWQESNHKLALSVIPAVSDAINPVEGRILDPQQMESIVTDVSTRLVIAGAPGRPQPSSDW